MEEVHKDGIVPQGVVLPRLGRDVDVRPSVALHHVGVGLAPDAVQILVKAVQQEGQELVSVMLSKVGELGSLLRYQFLKFRLFNV